MTAGDWIKVRAGLLDDPKVRHMADLLIDDPAFLAWSGVTPERDETRHIVRHIVVTFCVTFWCHANRHARHEIVTHTTRSDIAELLGIPGAVAALEAVGWAEFDDQARTLRLPDFHRNNVTENERRHDTSGGNAMTGAQRTAAYRARKAAEAAARDADGDAGVTSQVTRDKREGSNTSTTGAVAPSVDTRTSRGDAVTSRVTKEKPRPKGSRKAPPGFDLTPIERAEIAAECPGVDIDRELRKLRDHTFRDTRSDWPATARNWMREAFDRLGQPRSGAPPPNGRQTPAERRSATVRGLTTLSTASTDHDPRPDPPDDIVDVTARAVG